MSYAIIRTAGFQFRAEPGKTLRIPSLDADVGSTVTFEEVLLGSDGTKVHAGVPLLSGAKVTGEVVRHGKGEKVRIFRFARRNGYRRHAGHRQDFTEVKIVKVG